MVGNGSIPRRSGRPCWAMFATFSVGAFFFMLLASPISAEDGSNHDYDPPVGQVMAAAQVYSEEGENLTTPATPMRQFVWKVRNWMFHRDDEDVNIEVDAEATSEPTDTERTGDSKSWVRSVAAWFARGIRHLLEQLNPPENGNADGTTNGTEEAQTQDGTKPKDGPEDSVTKPTKHIFRPWTALPPPPPPAIVDMNSTAQSSQPRPGSARPKRLGMTANPDRSSTARTARTDSTSTSTPVYTKPPSTVAGKTIGDSAGGKFPTSAGKTIRDASTDTPAKKPKRHRPKPIPTTSTTPEMPPLLPFTTEEVFVQDTGNEI